MNRPHILKNWLIVSKLIFLLFVSTVTQALETRAYSLTYDPISGQVKTIDGPRLDVTDITTFDYHPGTGVLEKVTNALGHITLLSNYDGSGRVGTITDANGLITTLTYTPRGWLKSRTTGGYTTHFTYDGVGQLTNLQFATGEILTYTYNAARYLTDITDRQGNNLHYTLDLNGNRIKEETWNNIGTLKHILEKEYNQLNQLKLSIGGEGQINRFEYDSNGNLSAQMDPRQTGNDRIAALTLNPTLTDNTVTSVYDALNRLMSRIHLQTAEDVNNPGIQDSSDDIVINYAYNALDQLILVTDATGLETRYDYNALGDLKSLTSPDTGITTYTYDEAGNRKTHTDAKGIITRYSYDALNRLTTISYPNTSLNITYTYDENNNAQNGIGRLTSMQDASGLTSYQYDLYGNLTSMTSQRGMVNKTIAYTYNGNNQLNQITYPSGRTVNYRFDITGRVELVTTIDLQGNYQRLLGKIRYQPFGPVTSQIYGNALMANVGHNLDFRQTSLNTPSILQRSYGIDEASNIVNISDILNPAQDQNMTYDGLSRLDTALGSYGSLSYLYDDSHNRIQRTQDQITDIYNYPIDSHHLQDINSSQIYQYDANGNTMQLPNLSIQTPLIYGDHNRLSQVNGYSYTYNGHGERVIKDNNAGVITYYEYDQEGKLLVETDGNGLTLKEYVYANGQLIAFHQGEGDQDQDGIADQIDNCSLYPNPAQIDSDQDGLGDGCDNDLDNNSIVDFGDVVTLLGFIGSTDAKYDLDVNGVVDFGDVVYILGYLNQAPGPGPSNGIYYVHNDHLGTPQTITDQNQSVFWQANYNPFGKATITRQTITNNIRFPGQYFDQETGLHYNYHRYYDPQTGRYITSDPIGLAGGLNTYGYVGGNPISYVDPVGLLRWSGSFDSKAVTAPVGAGVADFTLTSKCINGKQATVEVVGIGPALGAGLKLSGSKGSIEFEDHKDSIQPNVFNGTFGTIGASFQIGKFGGSIGKIRLGSAFSRGPRNVKGIDVGVSTVLGSSTVLDVKYKVCSCE